MSKLLMEQIKRLNQKFIDWNVNYSVYPYNAYTVNELCMQIQYAVVSSVELSNDTKNLTSALYDWVKNEGLNKEVKIEIEKAINDGRLGGLINNTLLKDINDKVTNVETSTTNNINTFKNEVDKKVVDFKEDVNNKLNQSDKYMYEGDIARLSIKKGDKVDIEFLRKNQMVSYGKYINKLYNNLQLKIVSVGDSLTYGQDTTSSDKRPPTSGNEHFRASVTYPEKLNYLLSNYNNNVVVENMGKSGYYCKKGFDDVVINIDNKDLAIIMFGTNDSFGGSWIPNEYNNIDNYIYWYEQILINLLSKNIPCIIVIPPLKKASSYNDTNKLLGFTNRLIALGLKYCIPVLKSYEFLNEYLFEEVYSDTIHLNGLGYSIIGQKIFNAIINKELLNYNFVGDNVKINTENCINYISNDVGVITTSSGTHNPNDLIFSVKPKKEITFSFYTNTNDLIVFPYSYSQNKYELILDGGLKQGQNTLDGAVYENRGKENINNKLTLSGNINKEVCLNTDNILRIVSKGWHTLTIKNISDIGNVIFNGLEFQSFKNEYVNRDIYVGAYNNGKHNISFWEINMDTLIHNLDIRYFGSDYYRTNPVTIILKNMNNSEIRYCLEIGSRDIQKWNFGELSKTFYNNETSPTQIINNITYNKETNILRIDFDKQLPQNKALACWLVKN